LQDLIREFRVIRTRPRQHDRTDCVGQQVDHFRADLLAGDIHTRRVLVLKGCQRIFNATGKGRLQIIRLTGGVTTQGCQGEWQ